jgi:hypothetical protein
MKKVLVVLIVVMLISVAAGVFGQVKDDDPFYKSVNIVKILSHSLGYKIYYLKMNMDIGNFYVPMEWFRGSAGKGSIIFGTRSEYPYFTIYWNKGEFSYIKLFLMENMQHESWGVLRAKKEDVEDKFDLEEPEIEF